MPGPLDEIVGREELGHVRHAFARLDPDDREVLELRVVGGLSAQMSARSSAGALERCGWPSPVPSESCAPGSRR